MSLIKSFRYNPFTNQIHQKVLTEYYIIEYLEEINAYGVKLKEAPLHGTSITVSRVSDGFSFSEVSHSTNPQQGEFRVDYYNINNDPINLGTGYIEFNPADAGTKVMITYTGIGEYGDAFNPYYNHYSRMEVGNSFPTSPNHSDLFYNQTNNTLWRYDTISSNWIPVDWQTIIKASPEYQANRLRVNSTTGKLEISPDGTNWYECIPAVGSAAVELATLDNTNFTYKYWIAPGQTAIIKNANHIPIVYAKDIEPFFDGAYWYSYPYEYWIGIRPSNILISDGDGQYMAASGTFVFSDRYTNFSIVPIFESAGNTENWANFVLRIRNNQRFLTNAIGLGHFTYILTATNCSGTAANLSYWLGPWYTISGVNFQVNVLTLTRRA